MPLARFSEITKPIERACSSTRWATRLAVRARIGTPFMAASGNPASSRTAGIAPEMVRMRRLPGAPGGAGYRARDVGDEALAGRLVDRRPGGACRLDVLPCAADLGRDREQAVD